MNLTGYFNASTHAIIHKSELKQKNMKSRKKRLLLQEIAVSHILILGWRIDDQTSPAELLDSVVLQKWQNKTVGRESEGDHHI